MPTAIHYPKPLHQQTAYRQFLPMHPYLDGAIQERIVKAIVDATWNKGNSSAGAIATVVLSQTLGPI